MITGNLTDAATLNLDDPRIQGFADLDGSSLSLTLKIAGGYGRSVPNFGKDDTIATLSDLKTILENDFSGQYAFMLRETSAAGDIFYGLKWDGAKLVADNPVSGVDVETAGDWG